MQLNVQRARKNHDKMGRRHDVRILERMPVVRHMRIANLEGMASVLVVDDNADNREVVSQFLSKAGFHVRSAPNGRAALISLVSEVPDVVILDMLMPEMDGAEFLHVIRSYLRWSTLPVIVLTAYPEGPQIEHVKQMGARCIFTKSSYELADLLACVNAIRDDPGFSCAAS